MTNFSFKLKNTRLYSIIALVLSGLLIGIDQLIKFYVLDHFKDMTDKTIPLINEFLHISYVENRGVAFGMMQGGGTVLIVVTSLIVLLVTALIIFSKDNNKWYLLSLSLILGGGIGNLIDRVARGFVIDYIDFRVINFAVFNFADCCVVIGTILFIIYIIFIEPKKKMSNDNAEPEIAREKISIKVSEHKNQQTEKVNKYINVVGEVCSKDPNPIIMSQEDIPFINNVKCDDDDTASEIIDDESQNNE